MNVTMNIKNLLAKYTKPEIKSPLTAEEMYSKAITGKVCSQENIIKFLVDTIINKAENQMRLDDCEVYYRFKSPINKSHIHNLKVELEKLGYIVKYISEVSCIITWEIK